MTSPALQRRNGGSDNKTEWQIENQDRRYVRVIITPNSDSKRPQNLGGSAVHFRSCHSVMRAAWLPFNRYLGTALPSTPGHRYV